MTEDVVTADAFNDLEGETSLTLLPDSWTSSDIDSYRNHPWLPSGSLVGLLLIEDEDCDDAGVPRPRPKPTGDPYGALHYVCDLPDANQRSILAQQMTKRLPACHRRKFVRAKKS